MKRRISACLVLVAGLLGVLPAATRQEVTKEQLKTGLKDTELQGDWIYDDLKAGIAEAKKSGKPMMVVLRCVPCVTFKQLDREVARREDPELAKLMDQYVCVRIVQAWGLDLSLFQFDNDLNWAVFLMNADLTIYGRFGTKCGGKDAVKFSTVAGLKKALRGGLECHAGYPANKKDFAAKVGPAPTWKVPEEMAEIQKRPNAKPADGTRPKCVHCHMIHEGEAWGLRVEKKPVPDALLWPFLLPDELGCSLDPNECATVTAVATESAAEKAGLKVGDRILRMDGQPILSIADVQWVLQVAKEPGIVKVDVERGGSKASLTLEVAAGWRQKGDAGWRTLVRLMRHRLMGVEALQPLTAEERKSMGLSENAMALRIKGLSPAFVKEKNPDAAAKLQKGDVLIEVDGRKDLATESAVLAQLMKKNPGQSAELTLLRGGNTQKVSLVVP